MMENVTKRNKEHPVKTRMSELQKIFPKLASAYNGVPYICPTYVDKEWRCPEHCAKCRKQYWLEEIE